MKKILFLALAFAPLAFTSCSDDDDPSKTELLTNKNWVMTAATIDPSLPVLGGGTTTNLYNQFPSCTKDNILIFKTDKTMNFDEGATKCNVSDPQTEPGSWLFNTTETILSITQDGETTSITIKTLTSNKLNGTYQQVINGTTYTIDATFEVK